MAVAVILEEESHSPAHAACFESELVSEVLVHELHLSEAQLDSVYNSGERVVVGDKSRSVVAPHSSAGFEEFSLSQQHCLEVSSCSASESTVELVHFKSRSVGDDSLECNVLLSCLAVFEEGQCSEASIDGASLCLVARVEGCLQVIEPAYFIYLSFQGGGFGGCFFGLLGWRDQNVLLRAEV